MTTHRRTVHFGAIRDGASLGGLAWRQLAVLVLAGLWALIGTRIIGGTFGGILGIVGAGVLGAGALMRPAGRLPIDWLAIGVGYLTARIRGAHRHAHTPTHAQLVAPAHLGATCIIAVPSASGEIGLIHDHRRLIAVLALSPNQWMLSSDSDADAARARWGGILTRCAQPGSAITRLQWTATSHGLGAVARSRYVDPARASDRESVARYLSVVDATAQTARAYAITLAIAIDCPRRGGVGTHATTLIDAARTLREDIRAAGLGDATLATPTDLATQLRIAHDPTQRDGATDSPHAPAPQPPTLDGWAPMAFEASWGSVRCDGSWHTTFWISQWPRGEVDPDILAPLVIDGTSDRTVSVVMAPQDPTRARRDAERQRTQTDADDDLRARTGFVGSIRRSRQRDAISTHERELADGHAGYRFTGYVAVSAASEESLAVAAEDVAHSAHKAQCELRRLWGEQLAGLAATLPLCRGI